MGVDVNLYAAGEVSDEELTVASALIKARSEIGGWDDHPALVRCDWSTEPRVELNTMARYYGPGYERGPWPDIYGAIRLLQAALPHCRVFYGGDSTDDAEECTDDFLAGMWSHFLGPEGDSYREEMRRWNERAKSGA